MNQRQLLGVLVVADVLFAFASVGAEGFFGWTLPPALAEYVRTRFSEFSLSNPGDVSHLLLLAATVLCAFTAWIGLVTDRPFARRLYLVAFAASLLLTLTSGPSVTTALSAMFRDLGGLVGGAIVGLVYFSDLASRFERPAADRAPSTERQATSLGA